MIEKEELNDKDLQRIYLQVNQEEDEETIDLLNVAGRMGKKKKLFGYMLMLAVCIGVIFGAVIVGFKALTGNSSYANAVISFSYDGIDQGQDPNGGALDVTKIKSTPIVSAALENLQMKDVDVEDVRSAMKITGVMPDSVKQEIAVINTVAEDAAEYYTNISDLDYFPSQYVVRLNKIRGLKAEQTSELLNAILSAYRDYFLETYANTDVLSLSTNVINYEDYDYLQAADMLTNQIDLMQNYVDARAEEAGTFRANSTGLSFGDLSSSIETIRTLDLGNFISYVQSRNLTKDAAIRVDYYQYQIEQYNLKLQEVQAQLSNVEKSITDYEKDPVIVMSNQDSVTTSEQKNAYYDDLVKQKLELTEQIASINTSLNENYTRLNALADIVNGGSEEEISHADTLLANLINTINSWGELVQNTTEEYYNTSRFADAYQVSVPAQYTSTGGLMSVAKTMILCTGVLVLLVVLLWCYDGLKDEIKAQRKKKVKAPENKTEE